MLTVRTSENTVITSFRLISERQDFSSVRTGENTVRARARIQCLAWITYFQEDEIFMVDTLPTSTPTLTFSYFWLALA